MSKEKKAFESMKKGIHLTFKNGWTVSVMIGPGNYCDNYHLTGDGTDDKVQVFKSNTAEVTAWNNKGKCYPNGILGYQSIDEIFDFISKIRRKKK